MRSHVRQFYGIATLTALEASRQPIFLLLTTSVLAFIALLPFLITHVIGDSARVVRDSALATQLVAGLILGCFAASATIARELRRGTLAAILSKPVGRSLFFLAKFCGVAMIMLVFAATTTLATMLAVRTAAEPFQFDWWGSGPLLIALLLAYAWAGLHNYLTGRPFVSRTYLLVSLAVLGAFTVSCLVPGNHEAAPAIPWNILPAGVLMALAMLLLSAFAVSLATRLDMTATLLLCLGVLMFGLMSDYLFGRRTDDHWIYPVLHGILPNWQHFWATDALKSGTIPWSYTAWTALYAALYGIAVLSGGLWNFNRMEVK